MRRKGCAKGAIGKRPGRPRREGCAGVVLGERDLLDLAIFPDFLTTLINASSDVGQILNICLYNTYAYGIEYIYILPAMLSVPAR